jgi:hypothetical protein
MGNSQIYVVGLAEARLLVEPSKASAMSPFAQVGANCGIHSATGAFSTNGWYRPGRLMSQSERLPS